MGRLRTNSFMIHTSVVVNEPSPEVWAKDSNGNIRKDGMGFEIKGDPISEILPAVWVKCVEGRKEGDAWGGYLQVTSKTNEGKWIDSSNGWLKAVSSKDDLVWFIIDMDDWYEIRQAQTKTGKALTIVDNHKLRFVEGAEPARFNLFDSTH